MKPGQLNQLPSETLSDPFIEIDSLLARLGGCNMAVLHSRSHREAPPRGVERPLTTPDLRNSPAIRLNSHRLCRATDGSPGMWQGHAIPLCSSWYCMTQLLARLPPERHERG
jgi:hypothetical protein